MAVVALGAFERKQEVNTQSALSHGPISKLPSGLPGSQPPTRCPKRAPRKIGAEECSGAEDGHQGPGVRAGSI